MTTILYLIGTPGTGKYTIAKEIAKFGYNICDNQLINNPIFSLLNYDGVKDIPEFAWEKIRMIRTTIIDFLALEHDNNYILTNCLYEIEGDHKIFNQVKLMAEKRNSIFVPVKLLISAEENIRRIQNKDRLLRYKSTDAKCAYPEISLISIKHPNILELDVTKLAAREAANLIIGHVKFIKNNLKGQ